MLIIGVDRFMSTMRGLVSLSGQIMGSLVVALWERRLDVDRARSVLAGEPVPELAPSDATDDDDPVPAGVAAPEGGDRREPAATS
ncbi:MAG: hypothetical protein L0I76_00520 [Pseudonocardia sp.]|nr:hypothetical protein [Pseudonocardia sp.]